MSALQTAPVPSSAPAPARVAPALTEQDAEPRLYRFSREDYYRMAEAGLLQDRRVELIGGRIIEMAPQIEPHYRAIHKTSEELRKAFGAAYWIRIQAPLSLGDDSDPEPDIAVVSADRLLSNDHPTTAMLVVEVSHTSLKLDRLDKAGLYAASGIGEYWVLNLRDRRLEVHRQPMADATHPFGWRYREVRALEADERITPLAAPGSAVTVADLLP